MRIEHARQDAGLLTIGEAAAILGVHPDTLKRWERAGRIKVAIRTPNGHRRFRRGDVEALLTPATADSEAVVGS